MSEADAYYDSLIAQGYPPHEALPYTQQYYPHFSGPRLAAPAPPQQQMVYAPVLTGLPAGQARALTPTAHEASKMGWVTLGLLVTSLVVTLYAFNSPAWMSGEVEEAGEVFTLDMGLSKMDLGVEGFGIPVPYNSFFCEEDWCAEAESAGTAGKAGLGIGILALAGAAIMTFRKQQGNEDSPFTMVLGIVGSIAIIGGAVAWYSMFPSSDGMALESIVDLNLTLGTAFYAAIVGGVLGIAGSVTSLMD